MLLLEGANRSCGPTLSHLCVIDRSSNQDSACPAGEEKRSSDVVLHIKKEEKNDQATELACDFNL